MKNQIYIVSDVFEEQLDKYLQEQQVKKLLVVCGQSVKKLAVYSYLEELTQRIGIEIVYFSDFTPNPDYESVKTGVALFHAQQCDTVMAVGGGSAIDVAKCIKLYANMPSHLNYLEQNIVENNIRLIAMPTTAGTGSEATRFAVIYADGEKQSITHEICIPDLVILSGAVLKYLPDYHRKASMLDSFCHAVESYWSVHSTTESRQYSKQAIAMILEHLDGYLQNQETANANMLCAANIAGKAINITQTTAGHAMCYKLTKMYGLAHGHAAALCVAELWKYMLLHMEQCSDSRGQKHLENIMLQLTEVMGCEQVTEAAELFWHIIDRLQLKKPVCNIDTDLEVLVNGVNLTRLQNTPITMDRETIEQIYRQILSVR